MCGGGVGFGNRRRNGRPFGRLKRCWGFPAGGDRGAERARIAAESMMPGVKVVDVARKHGATRWQVYGWRKKLRPGQLVMPAKRCGPVCVRRTARPETAGRDVSGGWRTRSGDRRWRRRDPRRCRRRRKPADAGHPRGAGVGAMMFGQASSIAA